jgi:hypothetical protein
LEFCPVFLEFCPVFFNPNPPKSTEESRLVARWFLDQFWTSVGTWIAWTSDGSHTSDVAVLTSSGRLDRTSGYVPLFRVSASRPSGFLDSSRTSLKSRETWDEIDLDRSKTERCEFGL